LVDNEPKAKAAKRVALNMKATPELRARVEKAAKANDWSIAQEVERRLISSYENDDRHGGSFNAAFMRMISGRIESIERHTGAAWTGDQRTFYAVRGAVLAALDEFKPDGTKDPLSNLIAIGQGAEIASEYAASRDADGA
jgi:hypothetical protein